MIVPESIGSSRLIVRHSVDLPDPDGPMTTTTSPRFDGQVDVPQDVQFAEVLVDLVEDDQRRAVGASRIDLALGHARQPIDGRDGFDTAIRSRSGHDCVP